MQLIDTATHGRRFSLPPLREVILADAGICVTTGMLSLGAARWLSSILDLPTALMTGSGAILLAYGAGLLMLGTRRPIPAPGVRGAIGFNLTWALACVVLLFSSWIDPNALGVAFILVNLAAVLAVAELEVMGLRASG